MVPPSGPLLLEGAMRISSDPADPFYSPHMHHCTCWVAGSERNNVVTIDEERRFALLLRRDEFGAPALDKSGAQIVEPYFGDVRVACPDWIRAGQDHDCQTEDALSLAIYGMVSAP